MVKIDGAAILAKALKAEGIEVIFSLTGGHIYRVYQEVDKLGIKVVDCRHEGAAAYAATGYAMASGKPGVVLLTAGPGVTNAVTQVCDCMLGDVPVLFLGGASATEHDLTEVLQEYDCVTLMKNNTLWSFEVQDTARIAEAVAVAFRNMEGAKTGPVYLEIPMDVLEGNKIDEKTVVYPENYRSKYRVFGDPAAIEKAADLLIKAERPCISIGNGAQFNCQNPSSFKELAEYLQIPIDVSVTNTGRFFDDTGFPLAWVGSGAKGSCDVLLLFNDKPNHAAVQSMADGAKLINVHRNHQNIGLNMPLDVGIIGYADAVAEQLLACIKAKAPKVEKRPWIDDLFAGSAGALAHFESLFTSDAVPIHPARCASAIMDFLNSDRGKEYCYVVDGGDSVTWGLIAASIKGVRHPFVGRGFMYSAIGCVGSSWGVLRGLYEAQKRPIIHSIGDGSFGQYTAELFTIAKDKIPYVCVIFNDANWGMIKAFSMYEVPEENHDLGAFIGNPNDEGGVFRYEKIAKAWGGKGICVEKPEDLDGALHEAVEASRGGVPAIVNVKLACKKEFFSMSTVRLYQELGAGPKIKYKP